MMKKKSSDSGFTMIELLVTMGIATILVLISVPVFIGYSKMTVDRATSTDVTIISQAFKEILIQHPSSNHFGFVEDTSKAFGQVFIDTNNNGVFDSGEPHKKINKSTGTQISIYSVGPSVVRVYGWNTQGKRYTSSSASVLFDTGYGEIQKEPKNSNIGQA